MADRVYGWLVGTDGYDGIPYLQCPHCKRKVSGKKVVFGDIPLDKCPDCGKELHFDNISEEEWLHLTTFFGENK